MNYFVALHEHKYGVDHVVFKSEKTYEDLMDEIIEVADSLGIDYEPDVISEGFEIHPLDINNLIQY